MTTLASQLTESMNLLTDETWNKGNYFRVNSGNICMCAHGAVQAVCNPEVRNILASLPPASPDANIRADRAPRHAPAAAADAASNCLEEVTAAEGFDIVAAAARAADLRVAESLAAARVNAAATSGTSDLMVERLFANRPDWVRLDRDNLGNLDSSYLLGLFGLTTGFNDNGDTTLSMVKDKYRQAIAFAEAHGL